MDFGAGSPMGTRDASGVPDADDTEVLKVKADQGDPSLQVR